MVVPINFFTPMNFAFISIGLAFSIFDYTTHLHLPSFGPEFES